jgi:hypothetical protein
MRTGSTPVTRTKGTTMSEPWFNWQNKTMQLDGLWVLNDFLTPDVYQRIQNEIRDTPAEWHNRYHSREISEHGDYPNCRELAGRLIPYLSGLIGGNYKCVTIRAYRDHPGSWFFPHLDGKEFAVNMQIYMPASDRDELGTQFCTNNEKNKLADVDEYDLESKFNFSANEFYTVPFRANWGYINDNTQRKIHKTLRVPENYIRESIHFNFAVKRYSAEYTFDAGLELDWYRRIGVAVPPEEMI